MSRNGSTATPQASTSRAPSPSAHSTSRHVAPAQVVYDLSLVLDPTTATDSTWQDATESSLEWLLSLQPSTPPTSKGKEKAPDRVVHWYCGADGAEQCWDSATFLLRLLSFKRQGEVAQWRDRFEALMESCCSCVKRYQAAKQEFKDRFLRLTKTDKAIQSFSEGIERVEHTAVLHALTNAGLSLPFPDDPSHAPPSSVTLASVPPASIYNCLVNHSLLQDDSIIAILSSGLPVPSPLPLPPVVSPGLLAFRLHDLRTIREWAQQQLDQCEVVTPDHYERDGLGCVLDTHLDVVLSRDRGDDSAPTAINLVYTSLRSSFWDGLASCIAVLSPDTVRQKLLRRSNASDHLDSLDIVQLVTSHLGDTEDHIEAVLVCFRLILDRLGPHFWATSEDAFQDVVLHAVLDNPAFESAFTADSTVSNYSGQPMLDWLPPFLASVAPSSRLFTSSLAIIVSTFLDRLQQLRFPPSTRCRALEVSLSLLGDVFVNTSSSSSSAELQPVAPRFPHSQDATKVLELHAARIVQFAFDPLFAGVEWKVARAAASLFVGQIAERDSKRIRDAAYALGGFARQTQEVDEKNRKSGAKVSVTGVKGRTPTPAALLPLPTPPAPVKYTKSLWDRAYETVKHNDTRGISLLVRAASASSNLEMLRSSTWPIKTVARAQMKAINDALEGTRQPLIPLLMSLADERTDVLLDFLSHSTVSEHIAMLLLSPVEAIHNTVQGLVKQAFDVTTRRECFRSLLFHFPDATLRGLSFGVRAFVKSARMLPQACGMAKRVVRCLSDVIDVLTAASDGLLRDATFATRGSDDRIRSKLGSFWRQMCEALALLFKRTPTWATYFENDEMTEWMRDAILFGVDMLDQVPAFELAIAGRSLSGASTAPSPSSSSTKIAESMMTALNDPLEELVAWLRLNDEDLLSSSFDLVRTMLLRFSASSVALRPSTIAKIKKFTDKSKKKDVPGVIRSSILKDSQLRQLANALDGVDGAAIVDEDVPAGSVRSSSTSNGLAPPDKQHSRSSTVPSTKQTTLSFGRSSTLPSALPRTSVAARKPLPVRGPNFSVPAMKNASRPRGVPWTTYSSKPTVDSSDESSSSDDDGTARPSGLAALALAQKGSPKIKRSATERRAVKLIEVGGGRAPPQVRTAEQARIDKERIANAARVRGVQDFSDLHRQILQWDPNHDGQLPPSMSGQLLSVPSSFASPEAYLAAYEPLLLAECWEQLRKAKEEAAKENKTIPCTIAGRQSVDDFTDIFTTIEHGVMPDRTFLHESDLILLRQGQHQTLAKVQSYGRKREFVEVTLRCHLGTDLTDAGPSLVAKSKWQMVKLETLSTIHREYSALQSVRYLELFPDILSPRPAPTVAFDPRSVAHTMAAYQVNEPQAKAIHGALKTRGFSLIQGPPGTGKTKTILGLIGAFIDGRPAVPAPIVVGQRTDPTSVPPVAKVLLCAPSNAAVDEVAKRLKDGIRNSDGQLFIPKVVRIGSDSAVDIAVKDIFLDELVERALSGETSSKSGANDAQAKMQSMRAEIDTLRASRDDKLSEIQAVVDNSSRREELHAQLKKIKAQIFDLSQRLDSEKDKAQQSRRAMDAQQRKMRTKILSEADVICATLSGSGHDYMGQLPFDFDTVIIDEAAQSVEVSSLIPLKYGCRRCVLVGDPLQLPPTVISIAAKRAGYERSLFVRMMERGRGSHLLSIQYRMHPNISTFPSAAFYDSRLTDGPNMAQKTLQPWHANTLFPPYAFFHVNNSTEMQGRFDSWKNPREAATALAIYQRLRKQFPTIDFDYRIGIVTPYKAQVFELKSVFRRACGEEVLSKITFNTVDGFQGQEKDIIILSCVRGGSADKGVGFLADTRRMNVALTRARSSLFVLGDSAKLRSNQYWAKLVDDAQARGLLMRVDANTFNSMAASVPPTVQVAPPSSKSTTKPIVTPPAFMAPLQTPKAISAQALASKTSVGSTKAAVKRPSDDSRVAPPPEKKPKMMVEVEKPELADAVATANASRPPPSAPVNGATPAPPRPKAKASLFMPSKTNKRPASAAGGGIAKRPPPPGKPA